MENFIKQEKLGEGTYGVVYKAIDKRTGEIVALKRVRIDHEEEGIPVNSVREISALRKLHHPNIIELREVIHSSEKLTLVFEYMDSDLRRYLELNRTGIASPVLKSYFYQILSGLYYCHSHRIMHRDIKPANLLLNKTGSIKLADFGLARPFSLPLRTYTHEVITLWYRSPEILLGDKDTPYYVNADIWSTGCVFVEMLLRKPLFRGDSQIDQLFSIFRILGTPNENNFPGVTGFASFSDTFPKWAGKPLAKVLPDAEPELADLISKMLLYDPKKRISARAALEHPYFNGISDDIKHRCGRTVVKAGA
jgi:serine/threonine protein kinase